jgi:hypothetical protein
MLAEVISFGGYVKDVKSIIRERKKHVHVIEDTANKVSVLVRVASRDAKTGKVAYQLFDSFDVGGASPEAVFAAAKEGVLRAAATAKK